MIQAEGDPEVVAGLLAGAPAPVRWALPRLAHRAYRRRAGPMTRRSRHVGLQGSLDPDGWVLAPDLVDEVLDRDRPSVTGHEEREQGPGLGSAQLQGLAPETTSRSPSTPTCMRRC
jgi:hypothetical protein